jgi:alpha-galactosidase
MRFPEEEVSKYREHLDWHFHENRRQKENRRNLQSRGWFCKDWMVDEDPEDTDKEGTICSYYLDMTLRTT